MARPRTPALRSSRRASKELRFEGSNTILLNTCKFERPKYTFSVGE